MKRIKSLVLFYFLFTFFSCEKESEAGNLIVGVETPPDHFTVSVYVDNNSNPAFSFDAYPAIPSSAGGFCRLLKSGSSSAANAGFARITSGKHDIKVVLAKGNKKQEYNDTVNVPVDDCTVYKITFPF